MSKKQMIDLMGYGLAVLINNACAAKQVDLSDAEIDQLTDAMAKALKQFKRLDAWDWLVPRVEV